MGKSSFPTTHQALTAYAGLSFRSATKRVLIGQSKRFRYSQISYGFKPFLTSFLYRITPVVRPSID